MGERCNRTAEVRGSIPLGSTSPLVKRMHSALERLNVQLENINALHEFSSFHINKQHFRGFFRPFQTQPHLPDCGNRLTGIKGYGVCNEFICCADVEAERFKLLRREVGEIFSHDHISPCFEGSSHHMHVILVGKSRTRSHEVIKALD